ncbi:hypothetical protein [Streptomyces albus]|uniref:hypothetical protein n=1 Tax=Streptomyces albus TaxID=1888 RepID=UPI003F1C353B
MNRTAAGSSARAVTRLDHRVEAATGQDIDTLWAYRDRDVLDERRSRLVDAHRLLSDAEGAVVFHRALIHRISGGDLAVDEHLLDRIGRTLGHLRAAAAARDAAEENLIAALEPVEAEARTATKAASAELDPAQAAALLAIAGGAKLHEHLLTGRLSVATASGTRLTHSQYRQLEAAGLVDRDTSHPLRAGQPVALTDTGRAALAKSRRRTTPATPAAPRPGTWPTTARPGR